MSSKSSPVDESTLIHRPKSIVEVLPLDSLFPREQPIHVEIGAGDGSFFAAFAQANPNINFIALERLLGRLRKIDRKCRRAGLQNALLLRLEADYFVRYLLPPESVEAVHIYFPDPWPKRRHWKNRLINEAFPNSLRRILRQNGIVYLRTDNQEYFDQMLASFDPNSSYKKVETPGAILDFKTDFERNFNKAGIATLHAAYQRIS